MTPPPPLLARFGEFELDERNARLSRAGRPVDLQPRPFEVLCALLRTPGQLVTKDALLDAVWGHRHVSESVLKTTMSQLRAALADDARQPVYIETAARRGYRFIAPLLGAAATPVAAGTLPAAATPPAPQPPAPPAEPAAALIARTRALAELGEAQALAVVGRPQVVLLAGEAGIGKSTLIDRFVAGKAAAGVRLATGQCVEHYGEAEPYMPVLEALNGLCRGAGGAALVERMRRVAPTWLVQLPWLMAEDDRQRLAREVAGATQDRMLREFGELLERDTAEQPLVLVLEDLHWSDHATVQLIGYLARRRAPAALLLIGSFRPTEVIVAEHPLARLRHELRLHRLCREIDLESFSEAEVGELLARRLDGPPPPEDFVRALHAHTEGLPLFVVHVAETLIDQGRLVRSGDGWHVPEGAAFGVPRHLAGVVEAQIGRLGAEMQRVLGIASIAGVEFLHLPLAAAMQLEPDALQQTLDAAVADGHWLREAGAFPLADGRIAVRYAFRHALYRHVFYERLGAAPRMQAHRRYAAALRTLHGPAARDVAAELALHHERGGEPLAAGAQLVIAAARAIGRSAAQEALRAARHGIALVEAAAAADETAAALELDLRVLEGLALSRLFVLSEPQVAAAFERADALGSRLPAGPAQVRALHGLWWVSYLRGDLRTARRLAERLGAAAGHPDADALAELTGQAALGLTLATIGELRTAAGHLQAALALHARIGERLPPGLFVQDPAVEAHGTLAMVCWWLGEPAAGRSHAAEAVARAQRIRHPVSEVFARNMSAALHLFAGEPEAARSQVDRIHAVIQAHGLADRPGPFSWLRGRAVVALGGVDAGLAEMEGAERCCRDLGMLLGLTGFHLHYADALRSAGRDDEALASAEAGLAMAAAREERFLLAQLLRLKGELLAARGDCTGARACIEEALDQAQRQQAGFHRLAARVAACGLAGAADEAARGEIAALLERYRDEAGPLVAEGRRWSGM